MARPKKEVVEVKETIKRRPGRPRKTEVAKETVQEDGTIILEEEKATKKSNKKESGSEGTRAGFGKSMKVEITFLEPVLGTFPTEEEIYREFIASKAPDAPSKEDEVENLGVDEVVEKGMTIFPKLEDGTPYLYDYQVKGFFKNACSMLKNVSGTESSNIKAFKKYIDGLVMIVERRSPFYNYDEISSLQRPLRAQTAQGERIALANSEMLPAGTKVQFTIECFKSDIMKAVVEWLDYGRFNGFLQWHNGGYGRFTWRDITEE